MDATEETRTPGSVRPIVIIGAPRSGTNMLRDALCQVSGPGTWPCDEINAVWRCGNGRHPTDELRLEHARPEVKRYIRRAFDRLARRRRVRSRGGKDVCQLPGGRWTFRAGPR